MFYANLNFSNRWWEKAEKGTGYFINSMFRGMKKGNGPFINKPLYK